MHRTAMEGYSSNASHRQSGGKGPGDKEEMPFLGDLNPRVFLLLQFIHSVNTCLRHSSKHWSTQRLYKDL